MRCERLPACHALMYYVDYTELLVLSEKGRVNHAVWIGLLSSMHVTSIRLLIDLLLSSIFHFFHLYYTTLVGYF